MSEADYCDFLVEEFEQKILSLGPDNVAAFIAEPVMGAGGVLVAPDGYHGRIYEVCKKYDLLFISDEVVTAFGRLGEMIASEKVFGITPDIICVAKGVTSGYIPMGATLVSDEIYQAISSPTIEGSGLSMGYTYSGHPVAAAAALANIAIMENEKICEHVKDIGIYFQSELAKLSGLPMVGDVRGHHLMAAVEFVSDKQSRESFPPESKIADRVFQKAREKGVIIRPVGNAIIMSPPLIFSKQDCEEVTRVLSEVIPQVAEELCQDGYSISD
jgi:adenosylmethionine-8-amino-7-oxononanoate aminotransferase